MEGVIVVVICYVGDFAAAGLAQENQDASIFSWEAMN